MANTPRHLDYGPNQTEPGRPNNPAMMVHTSDSADGTENPFGHWRSNHVSRAFGGFRFQGIGDGLTYSTLDWTATTTGTGAAAALNTSGGVLLTAGSSSTFNTNLQSINLWTPAVDKWFWGGAILQTSDITTVGFEYNIGTSAVDPGTTNYTSVVGLKMAVGAGTIVGKVRGNTKTQSSTSTLYTAAATTDLFCGFNFNLGVPIAGGDVILGTGASSVTQTLLDVSGIVPGMVVYFVTTNAYRVVTAVSYTAKTITVATVSTTTGETVKLYQPQGAFFIGANPFTATCTEFSAAQIVQLGYIIEEGSSMYHNLHAKGSASNPTVLFKVAQAGGDR